MKGFLFIVAIWAAGAVILHQFTLFPVEKERHLPIVCSTVAVEPVKLSDAEFKDILTTVNDYSNKHPQFGTPVVANRRDKDNNDESDLVVKTKIEGIIEKQLDKIVNNIQDQVKAKLDSAEKEIIESLSKWLAKVYWAAAGIVTVVWYSIYGIIYYAKCTVNKIKEN